MLVKIGVKLVEGITPNFRWLATERQGCWVQRPTFLDSEYPKCIFPTSTQNWLFLKSLFYSIT